MGGLPEGLGPRSGLAWRGRELATAMLLVWVAALGAVTFSVWRATHQAIARRRSAGVESNCAGTLEKSREALNLYTIDEVGCVAGAANQRAAWLACYGRLAPDLNRARAAWRAARRACRGVSLPRPRAVLPAPALSSAPRRSRDLALLRAELVASRAIRLLPLRQRGEAFVARIEPLMRREARLRPGAIAVR